jgi:chromosome segregation ATPase
MLQDEVTILQNDLEEKGNEITSLKSDLDEAKEEKEQAEKTTMKIW